MTVAELERRVAALEQAIEQMQKRSASGTRRWWVDDAGRFANDPVFDEIVRLGRRYRESLRTDKTKANRARS
jgi:hypothetical protein